MPDGDLKHLCCIRMSASRIRPLLDRRVADVAAQLAIALHLAAIGPIRRLICRKGAVNRINAKGEKLVEALVERRQAESTRGQQIPIESFQMPHIKNDPVSLGYWSIIQSVRANGAKQFVSSSSGFADMAFLFLARSEEHTS